MITWVTNSDDTGRYWYVSGHDNDVFIDVVESRYVIRNYGSSKQAKKLAGPFDTLEAAQAAYLLMFA